jgi:hypothetical protein
VRQRASVNRFLSRAAAAVVVIAISGCARKPPIEPLKLDGNMLTIDNRSAADWTGVEVRLNKNHTVTVASIPAGGRLQVPLDAFVAGFGQRFDYKRTQITDLRLTAKLPDGTPLELVKEFTVGGLEGAFGGKR